MINYTFGWLESLGVFQVLLPFILIFTLVYAILHKTKILGDHAKNFNMVIAFVMGTTFVVPHVFAPGSQWDMVPIINLALPKVSVLLVAILMILLIFGVWGSRIHLGRNSLSGIIALVAFLSVIYIFGSAAGWWGPISYLVEWGLMSPDIIALVVTILVFAIVIWFVTKDDSKTEDREEGLGKFFGPLFDKDRD